eukprot:1724838-Pleurochrysis_carterae.AAC.4
MSAPFDDPAVSEKSNGRQSRCLHAYAPLPSSTLSPLPPIQAFYHPHEEAINPALFVVSSIIDLRANGMQ